MKKVIFIFAIILTALTSCEKEEVTIATSNLSNNQFSKGFVIENGYIKFNSIHSYDSIIRTLFELDHSELKSFTNSLGYTTLYDFNHKTGLPVDSIKIQTQDV